MIKHRITGKRMDNGEGSLVRGYSNDPSQEGKGRTKRILEPCGARITLRESLLEFVSKSGSQSIKKSKLR